jgi:two-component system response regulator HydG
MSTAGNVLVIDDEESMRIGCAQTLAEEGYRVESAENGQQALALTDRESFDVVLLDLKMPGIPGMEVLKKIKEEDPSAIVIVITGHATIEVAVEAMREGAYDFITKPFTPEVLAAVVNRAVENRRRALEHVSVSQALEDKRGANKLIGRSPAIMKVLDLVKQVAPTDSTVLIHGETGVGKELLARTIHHLSGRRDEPFVVVDCGTLVETLFESEMFGHAKGAFTGAIASTQGKFELANRGTIFLDEIANITVNMQSRLLRVIQEKEVAKVGSLGKIRVDVRIISATNRDLKKEIEEGRFRLDLYYRLNVVPIHLPPLRERREDIPVLAEYFLAKSSLQRDQQLPRISPEAMQLLRRYDWPGNVRELKNAIECATVTCTGDMIAPGDLPIVEAPAGAAEAAGRGSLAESEKREIVRALRQFNGHRARTAEYLGINRKTLREKIRRYGIEPGEDA